jgi:hypothetical protein
LNLQCAPFNLPPPIDVLIEDCKEGGGAYIDKALGLWVAGAPDGHTAPMVTSS